MLSQHKPRVMTLDLSMPGMDGFSVLEFTRARFTQQELKIIVISALDSGSLDKAKALGANATLTKPFSNHDLTELFEAFMQV